MSKKGFSYAEAMVTMLIVAIIMVASTPIVTKKMASKKADIWGWSDDGNGVNAFFSTPKAPQRVIIGANSAPNESARLIIYEADDGRPNPAGNTLPPIVRFLDDAAANANEIGRITTTRNSLGIGLDALNLATNAAANSTAIGAGALSNMTIGTNNTAIGYNACMNIQDGSGNICIGANSGPRGNATDQLFIDNEETNSPLIHADFDDDKVTINGRLFVDGINVNDSLTNLLSDARLKNIKGNSQAGLKEINKLQIKNYTYKKDKEKIPHVGVIAQELQKVFPNAVTKDKEGYLRIRQEDMFYAMINAIKELDLKFNKSDEKTQKLEQEVSSLKEENAKLLQRLEALEQKTSK